MIDIEVRDPELDEVTSVARTPLGLAPPTGTSTPWPPSLRHDGSGDHGHRGRRWFAVLAAATLVTAAAAGGGAGWLAARSTTSDTTTESPALTIADESPDVVGLIDAADDSILAIEVTLQYRQGPFVAEGEGAGTGIVLTSGGLVLTNAHVVEDATTMTVILPGETDPRDAELVGVASDVDVAVIRVADVSGLVPATFADSDGVQVGQDVIAIGNALDLGDTMSVTRGIVSALDRTIEADDVTYTGLIQTDAAISSGNSGGALLDMSGAIIGMSSAAAASSSGVTAENIGFAIPSDRVLDAIADIGVSID